MVVDARGVSGDHVVHRVADEHGVGGTQASRCSANRTGSGSGLCRVQESQPTIVSM